MPTGFQIIGAHCCNPSGAAVVSEIGAETPHVHFGANASDPEHFSAVISSRFHPVGDFVVARKSTEKDQDTLASRIEIAQKWNGVTPDQLLTGVQQMVQKKADGEEQINFAIPVVVPTGSPVKDEATGEMTIAYKPHPMAWVAERNQNAIGDQMTRTILPDVAGQAVDHYIVSAPAMA